MPVGTVERNRYSPKYVRLLEEDVLEKRDAHTMEWVDPQPSDQIMNIATGDSRLTLLLAPLVKLVVSVDVSVPVVRRARLSVRRMGFTNVRFQVASLVDFEVKTAAISKVVVRDCMHHLIERQRQTAAERLYQALVPGGVAIIQDIIFPFPISEVEENLPDILHAAAENLGSNVTAEINRVIKRYRPLSVEKVTAQLSAAGFDVSTPETRLGFYTTLRCVKR